MSRSLTIPEFTLESGAVLRDVPVAYHTWGALNEARDNVIVVCHALTGDSNVENWWGPLLGPGRLLDTDRYFVVCANAIGSPYGTVSPVSIRPDTGTRYGADFPAASVRDTVALHRLLLEHLGVRRVAMTIGGSMGGMQVLEWGFHSDFVGALVPIGVGGRHSAWCIAWSEAQRQAIYADPNWQGGRYEPDAGPAAGLAAARMMAMISYRSRQSFEARFARARMAANEHQDAFAVESYLRYQGDKLVQRFDANCYVHLTRQMDTHDVSRGRGGYPDTLRTIRQPTFVIGIDTDILYPLEEQEELSEYIPDATLEVLESAQGHDSFLIAFDQIDALLRPWMESVVAAGITVKSNNQSGVRKIEAL